MKCPVCKSEIVKKREGYFCTDPGCGFVVPSRIRHRAITAERVEELVQNRETDLIYGFYKKGSSERFPAKLILESDNRVSLRLETIEGAECPLCGAEIYVFRRGYKCISEDCSFVIFNKMFGRLFSRDEIRELLLKGKTGYLQGFRNTKKNRVFEAKAVLVHEEGRVVLEYS